jgi:hypothetical protein
MKYLILAATALIGLACSSHSQTIKSLGYDTTNGRVIYGGTNPLTFTNPLQFESGVRAATRTNLGLGATWLTNTDVTNFRTAIGLGTTNNVEFRRLKMIAANATDNGDDATLWLDTSGTNKAAVMRLSGTGGGAEKYNAYLQGGSSGLQVSAANGFRVLSGPTAGLGSVLFAVNSSGNATLNGVNSTAPSQTADSASSLMTRSLSDAQSLQLSVRPHNSGFVSFFGGSTTTATNGATAIQNQLARVSSGNAANNISRLQNRDILPVGLGAGPNAAINFSQNLEFGFTGLFAHNSVANATTRIMFGGTNGYISGTNVAQHVGWRADGANNVYATFGDGTNYTEILATTSTQIQRWWHIAANNGSVVWSIDGTQVASTTNGPNSSGGIGSGHWFLVSETIDAAIIYWEVWQLFTRRNL